MSSKSSIRQTPAITIGLAGLLLLMQTLRNASSSDELGQAAWTIQQTFYDLRRSTGYLPREPHPGPRH